MYPMGQNMSAGNQNQNPQNPTLPMTVTVPPNPNWVVARPVYVPPTPPRPPNSFIWSLPPLSTRENTIGWVYRYTVPLAAGKMYLFDCWNVGKFWMKGGACGYFTVEFGRYNCCSNVSIYDENGAQIFSEGNKPGDRITVIDHAQDGTTHVIFTQGGRSAIRYPITIPAIPNELIYLTGAREFVVNGDGAMLVHAGTGKVTVKGNLQRLGQDDTGTINVHGSVLGVVFVSINGGVGGYTLTINGNVTGEVVQEGGGSVHVKGDVHGDVTQSGNGHVIIGGKHLGTRKGNGTGTFITELNNGRKDDE